MTPDQYIEEVITRYLSGTGTPEEKKELVRWMLKEPENEYKFRDLEFIWDISRLAGTVSDPEMRFESQKNKIQPLLKTQFTFKQHVLYPLTGIVATLLILITAGYYFLSAENNDKPQNMMAIATPPYTKGNITLPDESNIWLNQNSTLSYPDKFSGKTREVRIIGEACFDISKDNERPFIVDLGDEKIEVLGTLFNVKNSDDKAEIVLLSGIIQFTSLNRMIQMNPNEKITYIKDTRELKIEPVDASIYNLWTKEKLVFDNADLSYVIACLEKWFDTEITPSRPIDKISGITLSVRNETLMEVLNGIECIAPIRFNITEINN